MFKIDEDNPIVRLCVAGIEYEQRGEAEKAAASYRLAWDSSTDDLERCIAAHYVARCVTDAQQRLDWNTAALNAALSVGDERVEAFYASLHLNVGKSHEDLEQWADAARAYADAEVALRFVPPGPYRDTLTAAIARAQERVA